MDPIPDWLACPECGFDDFTDEHVSVGGSVKCPECGEQTDRRITYVMQTPEELAEVTGQSASQFTTSKGEAVANDAKEVTDDGIQFHHSEDYYKSGAKPFDCPECGEKCQMSCGEGFKDVAYCNSCRYEFVRSRDFLVDDVSDRVSTVIRREERPVYEEYSCEHCGKSHPYTRPSGEYNRPHGELHSYEQITLNCPCGNFVDFDGVQVGDSVKCECGRKYALSRGEK